MKINNFSKTLEIYNSNKDFNVKKSKKLTCENDNLTISTEARDFQTIKKYLANVKDIRQEKVDDIKNKIKQGSYNISSYDIASKILEDNGL